MCLSEFFVTFIDVIVHFWLVHNALLFVCARPVYNNTVDIKCLLLTVTQNVLATFFWQRHYFRYQISPNDRIDFTGLSFFSSRFFFSPFSIVLNQYTCWVNQFAHQSNIHPQISTCSWKATRSHLSETVPLENHAHQILNWLFAFYEQQ